MHKNLMVAIADQEKRLPSGIVKSRKCGGRTFHCEGYITYFDKFGRIEAYLKA